MDIRKVKKLIEMLEEFFRDFGNVFF